MERLVELEQMLEQRQRRRDVAPREEVEREVPQRRRDGREGLARLRRVERPAPPRLVRDP